MNKLRDTLLKVKPIKYFVTGKNFLNSPVYIEGKQINDIEASKKTTRTDIINYTLSFLNRKTCYLEIGVRNPADNFDLIMADEKYAVDPGIEFEENPVDFQMTSDEFFEKKDNNKILSPETKFDVVFIDGLHLAHQVDRDISNATKHLKDDGFIILHDCNPPTEWNARIDYNYFFTPAICYWNGTTWKAFVKWRSNPNYQSCCIDTDYGVGILAKRHPIGKNLEHTDPFFEYNELVNKRKEYLNLISFDEFKNALNK